MTGKLVLDCDEVLAGLAAYVVPTATDNRLTVADLTTWNFFDALTDDERSYAERLMADAHTWRVLPCIPGALHGVAALRAAGVEFIVATAPWQSCRSWLHVRYAWLRNMLRIGPDQVLAGIPKHWVTADVFIDDKPENVMTWAAAHTNGRALLYDRPANQYFDWPDRFTWADTAELVQYLQR